MVLIPTRIIVNPITGFEDETITVTATLLSTLTDLPVPNKSLSVTINSILIGTLATDLQGIIKLDHTITETVGTYTILIAFTTDTWHEGSTNTSTLKVNAKGTHYGDAIEISRKLQSFKVNLTDELLEQVQTEADRKINSKINEEDLPVTIPDEIIGAGTYFASAYFLDTIYPDSNNRQASAIQWEKQGNELLDEYIESHQEEQGSEDTYPAAATFVYNSGCED